MTIDYMPFEAWPNKVKQYATNNYHVGLHE